MLIDGEQLSIILAQKIIFSLHKFVVSDCVVGAPEIGD